MSKTTAVATRSVPSILRSRKSTTAPPATGFRKLYNRAKAKSDDGLLLFRLAQAPGCEKKQGRSTPGNVFVAFFEDAEILGEVLGICPTRTHPSGPLHISLTEAHLTRNFRFLRNDGYADIRIADLHGRVEPDDDTGEVDWETGFYIREMETPRKAA